MTENITKYYTTGIYKQDHTIYSGEISIEDFNTYQPNKNRINNQVEALNFQSYLENKKKKHEEEEKYKTMTLDELRKMRLISNTNGRPLSDLTDEKWQKEYSIRKLFITPYPKSVKKLKGKYSKESGMWNEEKNGTYYGCTNWQQYCSYINDVLNNIRAGQVDYCYFIYQILDLAKFHYDNLKTRYCDGYWEVWLER